MQLTIERTHFAIDGTTLERPVRVATLCRLLGEEPRITEPTPSSLTPRPLRYYSWDDSGIYCAEATDNREVVAIYVTLNPDIIPENRGTIPARNPFLGELVLYGYRFTRSTLRSEFPSFTSDGFIELTGTLWRLSCPTTNIALCWQSLPDITYIEDGKTRCRDWRDTGRLSAVFFELATPKITIFQKILRQITHEHRNG